MKRENLVEIVETTIRLLERQGYSFDNRNLTLTNAVEAGLRARSILPWEKRGTVINAIEGVLQAHLRRAV